MILNIVSLKFMGRIIQGDGEIKEDISHLLEDGVNGGGPQEGCVTRGSS